MKDLIIALLKEHEYMTGNEMQNILGVSVNTTLGSMVRHNVISCSNRPWVNGIREDRRYFL